LPGNTGYVNLAALTAHPDWWLATVGAPSGPAGPGPNSNTIFNGGTNPQYCTLLSDACTAYDFATVGSVTGPGMVNFAQWWAWVAYMHYCVGTGDTSSISGGASKPVLDSSDPATGPNVSRNCNFFWDNRLYANSNGGNWENNSTYYTQNDLTAGASMANAYKQGLVTFRSYAGNSPRAPKHMINSTHYVHAFYPAAIQNLAEYPMMEWWAGYWEPFDYTTFSAMLAMFAEFASNMTAPGGNWGTFFEGPGNKIGGTGGAPGAAGTFGAVWSVTQPSWTAADWQAWRWQAASVTMGLGIAMTRFVQGSGTSWFDELDAGVGDYNWLGAQTVAPYAWSGSGVNAVWRADYTGGSVLVLPREATAAQTFNLPYSGNFCTHTANHSDANYCKGTAFTTANQFTMQPRDGLFIRMAA
jgi:hypothetical protein